MPAVFVAFQQAEITAFLVYFRGRLKQAHYTNKHKIKKNLKPGNSKKIRVLFNVNDLHYQQLLPCESGFLGFDLAGYEQVGRPPAR